jgi:osomolarity two-component system, sensor histidine kinase SLN1
MPTRTFGDIFPLTQADYVDATRCEVEGQRDARNRPPLVEESSADTTRTQRPTFVALPSPRPFNNEDNPLASPTSSRHSGSDSGSFDRGMHVLVVDDDPWTRTLMKRMLMRLGCKVSTAENGEAALDMILGAGEFTPSSEASGPSGPILDQAAAAQNTGRYAVVFLDNQMPVMSGLKAVARLREMGRRDFIVGITGNALLSDQEEYLAAGVDRYVSWPASSLHDLFLTTSSVLTKPVQERSLKGVLTVAGERRKRK